MAVKIRLKRIGKRKQAYFRIVVADSRVKRDGKVIDDLGYYQPWNKAKAVSIDRERYEDWLRKGAVPTETVRALFGRMLRGGAGLAGPAAEAPEVAENTNLTEGEDRSDG